MKEDIGEHNNLIEQNRDMAAQLAEELTEYLKEKKAQMPVKKADGEPVSWPDHFFL